MVGERDLKFYSELKQMNEDLLSFLKETNEKSPYFDFTPTLNDYVKQIEDLDKQYPEKSGDGQAQKQTNVFNINASPFTPSAPIVSAASNINSTSVSQPAAPALAFGQITTTQPTFIFGAPALSQTTTATSPSPFFSFSIPNKPEEDKANNTKNTNEDANDSADDDAPPPDPKIDRYEEPDAKYSVKCKLYAKQRVEGPVSLLGVGFVYLKALDTPNKLQVIFRQEPDLRRVLLNEIINPSISGQAKLMPKAVQIAFPSQSGDIKTYILKFRDDKTANAILEHLNVTK